MRRLKRFVHIYDGAGALHSFGPNDAIPAWAEARISNPSAWEADRDEPTSENGGGAPAGPPPHSGRGSGRELWADYASSIGVDPEGMSREEIIDAVEAAEA